MKEFLKRTLLWIRKPKQSKVNYDEKKVTIVTDPRTDLWQKTYYGFEVNNAPILQVSTVEQFFSFTVKTKFKYKKQYDQCGIAVYLNEQNWLKASIEYENRKFQRLGSVVTTNGYSDWASTEVNSKIKEAWYRLSRRNNDFLIEYSFDGKEFKQMRICHLNPSSEEISFGIYACSPSASSFEAVFTNFELTDCLWKEHKPAK